MDEPEIFQQYLFGRKNRSLDSMVVSVMQIAHYNHFLSVVKMRPGRSAELKSCFIVGWTDALCGEESCHICVLVIDDPSSSSSSLSFDGWMELLLLNWPTGLPITLQSTSTLLFAL